MTLSVTIETVYQILRYVWGPIGVNASAAAFGAYDSYARTIVGWLDRGCSAQELETLLIKIETDSMGLSQTPSPSRTEAVTALMALREPPSKAVFYSGKTVREVRWYLSDYDLPETLIWARLRVFDDGTADASFSIDGTAFGFIAERYASYLLGEDEYVCFSDFDDEDDASHGTDRHSIVPPSWVDPPDKPFEFLGTY